MVPVPDLIKAQSEKTLMSPDHKKILPNLLGNHHHKQR